MKLLHFYRNPALSDTKRDSFASFAGKNVSPHIKGIETEYCFNVQTSAPLTEAELGTLRWLLAETFSPDRFASGSLLAGNQVIEVGPRMNFTTAWSTNAVSICRACGLDKIRRIERSRKFRPVTDSALDKEARDRFLSEIHDRMTECPYPETLSTFETGIRPQAHGTVPLIEEGISALQEINATLGLGLDAWDVEYYYDLFAKDLKRNPTDVECFDLSQSNSEHSRHWFFKGKLVVDGRRVPETLMEILKEPLKANPANSVIAFRDNSSAIRGYRIRTIVPEHPGQCSRLTMANPTYHLIFTAETHNFPSGVAPFPGAETGTGGRIRDVQATGRGGSSSPAPRRTASETCGSPATGSPGRIPPSNTRATSPHRLRSRSRRATAPPTTGTSSANPSSRDSPVRSACGSRTGNAGNGSSRSCSPAVSDRWIPATGRKEGRNPGCSSRRSEGPRTGSAWGAGPPPA